MRNARGVVRWFLVATLLVVSAGNICRAESENCGSSDHPSHYRQQPGDQSSNSSFNGVRTQTNAPQLEVNVCSGELHIVHSAAPGTMRLTITASRADNTLSHYIHDFSDDNGHAVVSIGIPGRYHPAVTLALPRESPRSSQINLGAGTLVLNGGVLSGDRELNVGAGMATLYLDSAHGYASLQADIGIGMLEDDLPHGKNGYFVVNRRESGNGKGSLRVNVGAGKIVLKPTEE